MSFWSNGHQTYADTYTKSLGAGDSVRITATSGAGGKNSWTPSKPGFYTVAVQVDDFNNRIPERNENNNWYQEDFCVLDSLGNAWNGVKLITPANNSKLPSGSTSTISLNPSI